MKLKKLFIDTLIIIVLIALVLNCVCCDLFINDESDVKQTIKELISADSFTVQVDGIEVLNFCGNSLYWKNIYAINGYDEYYFMPDNEGKHWVYKRAYREDIWKKEAYDLSSYSINFYYIVQVLGGSDEYMMIPFLQMISYDFDSFMKKQDSTYILKTEIAGIKSLKISQSNGELKIDIENGEYLLTVSKINKTTVELSEIAKDAEVGEIRLSL